MTLTNNYRGSEGISSSPGLGGQTQSAYIPVVFVEGDEHSVGRAGNS
jgi:hypothetical protein